MRYNELIDAIDDRLRIREFKVWRDVAISDDREVSIFATEVKFSLVRIPVHIFVAYSENPSPEEFKAFFEQCLVYSRKAYSRGLKRYFSSIEVVTCIATDKATPELVEWMRHRHYPWKFAFKNMSHGMDFYPALICLDDETCHYWRGWSYIGCALWVHGRRVIQETIEAATGSSR